MATTWKKLAVIWTTVAVVAPVGAQLTPSAPTPATPAEPASVLGRRPGTDASGLLGPYFESQLAGIAFRPPADSKEIRRVGNPDEIVQFVNDDKQWQVKVSVLRFSKPVRLVARPGDLTQGILEISTEKLKETPGAEVLRSDLTNVSSKGVPDTGLIAVRYPAASTYRMTQQAIVQFTDQVYYLIDLSSPGSKPGTPLEQALPEERDAVALFSAMVDSIKLLDRTNVVEEQKQRLFRTRTLLVNWTDTRLKAALRGESWLRLIQDGKDVGYSYVIEEEADRAGRKGILVGVRSRTKPGGPSAGGTSVATEDQVDAESMLFVSLDRKYEEWSNIAQVNAKEGRRTMTEIGTSNLEERPVLDRDLKPGDDRAKDPNQPPVRKQETYKLNVTYSGRSASAPIEMELPPFYLPQALGHLLPKLVPLNEPKTYMFASYINDQRSVLRRYVDVGEEKEVTLAGRIFRAIPVSDRIGLEGAPTFHYMTRKGDYLGSENKAAKIVILPADPETLQKIWSNNAVLTRPEAPPKILPK